MCNVLKSHIVLYTLTMCQHYLNLPFLNELFFNGGAGLAFSFCVSYVTSSESSLQERALIMHYYITLLYVHNKHLP